MKRKYVKPEIKSERMFERAVLACGKLPPGQGSPACAGINPNRS